MKRAARADPAAGRWWSERADSISISISISVLLLSLTVPAPLQAQDGGWNGERVLELVDRARERRQLPMADSALGSYRADVSGHIYFLLDREGEEPVLLRADQVALDLYWRQPDRVKQVVKGMRSEEQLPIKDFRYYLDRYTVIQNGFGDRIRVGEGRDVQDVPHPLAAGAEDVYDYRLGDSTTIVLPGQPDRLRVYEIQVRPDDFDDAAILGSLFVERSRGDLVRMTFTFTPSAYLDPRNERVEIMIENALWQGKYWLPREQRLLVRRELPQLDVDVGTVIRAALRVNDYEFNPSIPPGFFNGHAVVRTAGPEALREYDFEEGLYEGFEDVGLEPGASPGTLDAVDVDAIAGRIIRERYLRGISRVRLFAPSASHVLRYDRSEGLVTGAGVSIGLGRSQIYGYGGYAWGSQEPVAEVGWRPAGPKGPEAGVRWSVEGYVNRPIDLGLRPSAAGAVSTLAAVALGEDFRDIHPGSGGSIGFVTGAPSRGRWDAEFVVETHDPPEQPELTAPLGDEDPFRPVPPVQDGRRQLVRLTYERRSEVAGVEVSLRPKLEIGRWDPTTAVPGEEPEEAFGRLLLDAAVEWRTTGRDAGARGRLTLGAAVGATPPQHLWYIGGRNTLPGHTFHGYVGNRVGVADVEACKTVVPGLLRLRVLAAAGWTELAGVTPPAFPPVPGQSPDQPPLEAWTPRGTRRIEASAGVGIGLLHGLLRVDYAVPLGGGEGALILSVDPAMWSFL